MNIENVNSYSMYSDYVKEFANLLQDEYEIETDDDPHFTIGFEVDESMVSMSLNDYLTILENSDSEPYEWNIYVEDGEDDHRKVIQAMAYATLRHDVTQELSDRDLLY